MKKILVVCSAYPSVRSPVNHIFIEDQATVLAKQFDVMVYVAEVSGWRELFITYPRERFGSSGSVSLYRRRTRLHPRIPDPIFSTRYIKTFQEGFETILASWGRPDIIHAHVAFPAGWSAVSLAKGYGIPVILTEHTGPFSAILSTSGRRCRVREALKRAGRVVAVSPALANQMRSFYPGLSPEIIGNVIRTDYFVPQAETPDIRKTRFLTICLLNREKGVDCLLKAAARLMAVGYHNFELNIGGDGKSLGDLKKTAERLGLSSCCRFLGMLTRDQVREQMQSSDVFILPSLAETFGVVLGEAGACGKPVISTRCGGPEYVVTPETGILVEPADVAGLADAMAGFITGKLNFNPAVVRESVRRRFGEDAFLRVITALYREVLQTTR